MSGGLPALPAEFPDLLIGKHIAAQLPCCIAVAATLRDPIRNNTPQATGGEAEPNTGGLLVAAAPLPVRALVIVGTLR